MYANEQQAGDSYRDNIDLTAMILQGYNRPSGSDFAWRYLALGVKDRKDGGL